MCWCVIIVTHLHQGRTLVYLTDEQALLNRSNKRTTYLQITKNRHLLTITSNILKQLLNNTIIINDLVAKLLEV